MNSPTPIPSRILLIRPSALGDVARTVPVLAALKRAFPSSTIDWVVEAGFEAVIDQHPALHRTISFPKRAIKASLRDFKLHPMLEFRRQLQAGQYDLVLDCQGLGRSGLMAWATGSKRRVGHADAREGAWLAYTQRVPAPLETHTVHRMLSLAAAVGADTSEPVMRLYAAAESKAWLASQPWSDKPYVVLAPTSRWSAKQWPADRFASLGSRLADAGLGVVFTGAAGERSQVEPCLSLASTRCGVIDCVGSASLAHVMAIIEKSALVVANDSAAVHMATGFHRPLVGLMGPTRIHRVGPFLREADVIQHVTDADLMDHKTDETVVLMERITVDEVFRACLHRLA